MKRFIQGEHRGQSALLPESLDDYVADTNPVRVVDVFVDELDLGQLGSGMVGYNVQAAVDAKHHLIVTHEVTNDGVDRDQLSAMATRARAAMGVKALSAVADRGYFKGEEILACQEAGITVFVPKTLTSGATAAGRLEPAASGWSRPEAVIEYLQV